MAGERLLLKLLGAEPFVASLAPATPAPDDTPEDLIALQIALSYQRTFLDRGWISRAQAMRNLGIGDDHIV